MNPIKAIVIGTAFCLFATCPLQAESMGYDPQADPFEDLALVQENATQSGRRILVFLGGEWCSWCHNLHDFLQAESSLKTELEANFVFLKVNYSEENSNEEFLAQYPDFPGFPHLFVLDADGKFLHSQNTEDLEGGKSYSLQAFREFIAQWGSKDSN